jgi:hypothetical protein
MPEKHDFCQNSGLFLAKTGSFSGNHQSFRRRQPNIAVLATGYNETFGHVVVAQASVWLFANCEVW